jgi:nucleoside-diphosphate-sugar epimerase
MHHFITGGAGFFGCHLVRHLQSLGEEITVYDLEPLVPELVRPGTRSIVGDIRNKEMMTTAMKGADVVHHNAAVLPISRSGKVFWEVNVQGTKNVIEAAKACGAKKVLSVSTSAVYGIPKSCPINEETPLTPLGDYGTAKFDAEEVCRKFRAEHDLDISIVRPRTIVGTGRLGIFGILFDWIRRGKRVYVLGDGENLFQLASARDLADACTKMTKLPCRNEDFNIGSTEFSTVRADLEAVIRHAGTKARVQPINQKFAEICLSILDIFRLSPLVDWHYKTPHKPFYFDCAKAKRILGWTPQDSNERMMIDTYDWYLQNYQNFDKIQGTTHRKNVKQKMLKVLRVFS